MNCLVVVDMQNDFITGSLANPMAQAIVENVKKKILQRQSEGYEIIFTRDTHHEDYLHTHEGKRLPVEHCIEGTDGWLVADGLEVPNCHYIDKGAFGWTEWNYRHLANGTKIPYTVNYEKIEIVGVCTDICVVSNALILRSMFPEADIEVDASCCAGTTEENHNAALLTMGCCHIDITWEGEKYASE